MPNADDANPTHPQALPAGWRCDLPRCLAGVFLLSGLFAPAAAQVRTDGSVGAAQTLSGPAYVIPQALGRVSGNNLFHSFQGFSIASGQSATFLTSVTGNVVSRVTGGSASTINGALNLAASGGATPAFWFINPAGVVFGAGAEINVPGAFHVSTADYVAFADGSRFHADPAQASTFSAAQPEAFGFLGGQRQSVQIVDGALLSNGNHNVTIVAGDVLIDNLAEVRTTGGDIRIVALGQRTAAVGVAGALPLALGRLEIGNDSVVQSSANDGEQGGNVLAAAGEMTVDFSIFRARTTTSGNSGEVWVETGDLSVVNDSRFGSRSDGSGDAGAVTVFADGDVRVEGGSVIASNAFADGRGGDIHVDAANLRVADSGSAIISDAKAAGNAGNVTVLVAGATEIVGDGAWISSDAYDTGNAGSVYVRSGSLYIDARGGQAGISSETVNTSSTGHAGNVSVEVAATAILYDGGRITSSTAGSGNAGSVWVSAGSLTADGLFAGSTATGIVSEAAVGSAGDAGSVEVEVAGALRLIDGGVISSSSRGGGMPGWIEVAADSIEIARQNASGTYSAISSDAGSDSWGIFSGYVDVSARAGIALADGGRISTGSRGDLDAGYIGVRAGAGLRLDNGAFIASDASGSGAAGYVEVNAASLTMTGDTARPYISSDGLGDGDAGSVTVNVSGAASLSGASISSDSYGAGWGGNVSLTAGSLTLDDNAYVTSDAVGSGQAGNVFVDIAGLTAISNGSWISSDTYDTGDAGQVSVLTGSLLIDGRGRASGISSEALAGSSGDAGLVWVDVAGNATLRDGGQISSATYASGDAGFVQVRAGDLRVDGAGTAVAPTGVISSADVGAGHAGWVIVESPGSVRVVNGGQISSSTASAFGAAGVVLVVAREVVVDGAGSSISARAEAGSSGQTGYVAVVPSATYGLTTTPIVTDSITVSNGGEISIANDASSLFADLAIPGFIHLAATNITVKDARITASSTGNFAASDIFINFGNLLFVDPSQISTSSNEGDGGNIAIAGNGVVWLDRSQITTSVGSATNGNGGDISISADYLVMNNGFIQANTNAPASGGDIAIDVNALVSSYGSLAVGGAVPLLFDANTPGYNVIQAAAPDGVSGTIEITSPALDLAGSLADVRAQTLQGGGLGRSPCDTTAGSSLAAVGRGGLPPSARDALRVEPAIEAAAVPGRGAAAAPPLQLAQAFSMECRIQ